MMRHITLKRVLVPGIDWFSHFRRVAGGSGDVDVRLEATFGSSCGSARLGRESGFRFR